MRTIWNEGRVVGLSAYEIYVRQILADDPDATPASEREWLSTMLAMGSSMLVRVGTDNIDGLHYIEVDFPEDTRLCAANMIMGSCFLGSGKVDSTTYTTGWCTKVGDFGPLIHNVYGDCPSDDGEDIPPTNQDLTDLPNYTKAGIRNYMKIVDGIIIQPGTWTLNDDTPPWKDFSPTLAEVPKLRILVKDKIDSAFYLLLTGFSDKGVIVGTTGISSSAVNTPEPENGDFLGPAVFPWAAKIIFSVPTAFVDYMMFGEYTRKLPDTAASQKVADSPIIDMATTEPDDYYTTNYTNAPITMTVEDINVSGDNAAILTVYQVNADLPPALFGTRIPKGMPTDYSICPLDSIAPGNPKIYDGYVDDIDTSVTLATIATLEDNAPGTSGYVRDVGDVDDQTAHPATYVLYQRDVYTDTTIPVAMVDNTNLYGMLTAREIYYGGNESPSYQVGPYLAVEGVSEAKYFDTPVLADGSPLPSGYDLWTETGWKMKLKDGCEVLKETLPSAAQTDIDNTGYISATTIQADPTPYCVVIPYIRKRITGRLSDVIYDKCGYTVYTDNSTLSSTFASGGFWAGANIGMFSQITGDKSDYYGLIMGAFHGNNHVWAVHYKDMSDPNSVPDHLMDVMVPMEFNILVNGEPINFVGFSNTNVDRNTNLLGSYWDISNNVYRNGWAYINRNAPVAASTLPANSTGQVFGSNSLLPVSGLYRSKHLSDLYSSDVLSFYGIHQDYWNYTLFDFMKIAVYTDMGTKKPLDPKVRDSWSNRNIQQPQIVSLKTTTDPVEEAFRFNVNNSASSVGRTQLIKLPKSYQSTENYPVGTLIQTGRLQGIALSMIDYNGVPYILEGSAGDIIVPDTGLTWNDLIEALYTNKSLDILGDKLTTLRSNIKTVGTDYIEFQNGKRLTGV